MNCCFIIIYCQVRQVKDYDLYSIDLHEVLLCSVKLGFEWPSYWDTHELRSGNVRTALQNQLNQNEAVLYYK